MFGKYETMYHGEGKNEVNREMQVMLKIADFLWQDRLITPDEKVKLMRLIKGKADLR